MKTILVVQSISDWIPFVIKGIANKLPGLADYVGCTNSFDHALDLVPKDGELIVVTSEMFHDKVSEHRETVQQKIPDSEKNGNKLAEIIKEINNNAKVYVFSEFEPEDKQYLDGFIQKYNNDVDQSIVNLLKSI